MIETPENLKPYVEAIGEELTLKFIMRFGGSPVYLSVDPKDDSDVVEVLGTDGMKALAKSFGRGQIGRVPIAREWTVRKLKAQGLSVLAIARELRVADETVRRILNDRDSHDRQASFPF
ncbi:transposase family protein [Rhizobium leguminosarum]|uniref:transposase family protein n=1 Tax=Rhizobium leguminosarum TaxID=384 RepID=UPI00140F7C9A|nr:transposase family protein [Rhizobium leguminosarum]QIO60672.1 transposase family protein [Rhizobium leguminosarum bv. trifolii]